MLAYLSAKKIICYESFLEHTMSKDKYTNMYFSQMEDSAPIALQ